MEKREKKTASGLVSKKEELEASPIEFDVRPYKREGMEEEKPLWNFYWNTPEEGKGSCAGTTMALTGEEVEKGKEGKGRGPELNREKGRNFHDTVSIHSAPQTGEERRGRL